MENNRWGIIYCPKSGRSITADRRWTHIKRGLKACDIDYDHVRSRHPGDVPELMNDMIADGYRTIIIVGGDSALNDAVNSLMLTDAATRNQVALGLVPNGMMNDFAHFWDLHAGDPADALLRLKNGRHRLLDVGCVRYTNAAGESCRRYFLNCVNVGFVAAIMDLRRRTHHVFGSRTLSFLFSFILLIFQRMEYHMRMKINTDTIDRGVMTLCVGNATGYGQTPGAVPYNGQLDVSLVCQPKTLQLFEGIYLFLRGKFLNHRSMRPYRTREVMIAQTGGAPISIDGRLIRAARGNVDITIIPDAINFVAS